MLMTALAARMLTSCSEDDLGNRSLADSNTIAFATTQAKALTRAAETITSVDKFTVSAVNPDKTSFFSNEKFVYDESYGVFKSSTAHFWPSDGSLSFYAINEPGSHSVGDDNSPRSTYNRWDADKDLVAATVVGGTKQIPYPLTFKHLTSQIYVSAEPEDKVQDLNYKLVSVKLIAPSKGTYSFATATGGVGSWEIDSITTSEYSYNEALPMTFNKNGQVELSSIYWNILPSKDQTVQFKVEYQVLQSGKVISDNTGVNAKTCVIESPNFEAGKRYVYNFILGVSTNDEITFSVKMSDWGTTKVTDSYPANLPSSFELNRTKLSIAIDQTSSLGMKIVVLEDASKTLKWTSDHPEIASVNKETGVVKGVATGTAIITATTPNGLKKTCEVTVVEGDPFNGYEYVDLGLASGTLWAKYNVGSTELTKPGLLFAWGETKGYVQEDPDEPDYKFFNSDRYQVDYPNDTPLDNEHDAARANMGGRWNMPTSSQIEELINNTNNTYAEIDGWEGWLFESKTNGNTVFFPRNRMISTDGGTWIGYLWTKSCTYSNAIVVYYTKGNSANASNRIFTTQFSKYLPANVRGVIKL
jgi:hypothetical protein